MTHYLDKCKHGVVVRQCRCPGPKTVNVVPCPPMCPSEPTYLCDQCGKPRTKAEGGTVFTVCYECWSKPSEPKIQPTTDAQIAKTGGELCAAGLCLHDYLNGDAVHALLARIAADREKIAALEESHQELICLLSIIDMGDGDCLNEYGRSFESVQMLTKILAENAKMRKALEMIARSTPMDMDAVLVAREALK